jgi:hypothetical protein
VTAICRPIANEGEARVRGIGWCYEHRAWCGRDAQGNLLPQYPAHAADGKTMFDVMRDIREALCVPEAESTTAYARLHFARSVVATEIYNIMDSMPQGVGEAFIRDRIMIALANFPNNVGEDPRVWDDRPGKLGDAGTEIPRSP